jgi:hypothetical protein
LEADIGEGKVILQPKVFIDRGLQRALKDVEEGRVIGPFESADEVMETLKKQ